MLKALAMTNAWRAAFVAQGKRLSLRLAHAVLIVHSTLRSANVMESVASVAVNQHPGSRQADRR